jgi:transcriptional regulator with XRE-family HTH domain
MARPMGSPPFGTTLTAVPVWTGGLMAEFGNELRRRRQLAGLSLAQFANEIHYSKGHLSKIESGTMPATSSFARLCDAALAADGSLIALAVPARVAHLENADDIDDGWSLVLEPDGTGVFQPSRPLRPPSDPGHLDTIITLFKARLEQSRSLAQVLNAALILPTLIAETHTIRRLAVHAVDPLIARPLWRMAAQFAELVGRMTEETGNDQQALWWTTTAGRMAVTGKSPDLEHRMLIRQADIALGRDDAHAALELAQRVQTVSSLSDWVHACAAQREARACALLGEVDNCHRALDRARDLVGRSPVDSGVSGGDTVADSTAVTHGWTLLDLGRPAEAAEVLQHERARIPLDLVRGRTWVGVRQALAHATAGDISRASQLMSELLPDIKRLDSATVRYDLRLLTRELRRSTGQEDTRELLPALADLIRPGRPS